MKGALLVADRFVAKGDSRAIDLATGEHIVLKMEPAGDVAEQTRWAVRCDRLQKLHHRAIAPLLDYGCAGQSQRFEAWGCGSPWNGASGHVYATAARFLGACGLTAGNSLAAHLHVSHAGPVVVLGGDAGYVADPERSARGEHVSIEGCGLARIARRAERVLAESFGTIDGSRPHVVALRGSPGSGMTTTVLELARIARLNSLVPVDARLLNSGTIELLKGRSLFLIDDGRRASRWQTLISAALRSPRVHILLLVGDVEVRSVDGVAMEPLPPSELIAAVRPQTLDDALKSRISRAAVRARGMPGRFARLVWGDAGHDQGRNRPTSRGHPLRAAEQPAVYGPGENVENVENVEDVDDVAHGSSGDAESRAWPAPGELAALRRRIAAGSDLLKQGRHALGVRQLRQAVAGLARRDDWSHAGDGAIALASALLARGQTRSAQAVLDDAREYANRACSEAALIDIAILATHAWIDLARLDEAESVAGAAVAAARGINDPSRLALASLGLGRCLFWRGRYADADRVLDLGKTESLAPAIQSRLTAARARAAVGLRDYARAMPLARSSTDQAAAFVHLALDDLDAVDGDARRAIAAARAAHAPLGALRVRLMLAEVERRRGRPATADAMAGRVMRIDPSRLPPIVRARGDLLRELARAPMSGARPSDIVARHVARTGLQALALFAPDPSRHERGAPPADALMEEILEIVHLCQTADDEAAVLSDVCGRIRRQLRSSGVTMFGFEGATSSVLVGDGVRTDPDMAERVAAANIAITPHRSDDRIEAGAPVRYGGATIGVLTARWPLGTPHDLSRASTMLTAAAVAAAPAVSAVMARRRGATEPSIGTLLGVSPVMTELRRLVERAAAAPFAVLVEGESGSGKELVARAVHRLSARRDRPFTTLNCAALPDELLEAELFGHARGAFTGAVGERIGVFEEAHGGTLLLDEVGELSPRAQAKLLRVIQEGELRRIGENLSRRVDVRIVAATNRELRQETAAGRFRLDLLYRLDVIRIAVPPLRERRDDIALLVDHCWREATARMASRATLGAATIAALARYDWPGNVRELQNVLAALAVRCPRRGVVPPTALAPPIGVAQAAETHRLDAARRTFEERFVRAALVRSGGHRARAAAELGVTRQGLTKLMTRLGITDSAAASQP